VMALPRRYWSWRDVAAKAAWPWHAVAGDVTVKATWPWHDESAESCSATEVGIYDQSRDVRLEPGCTYILSMYNG
jgi:hypothetical protein